jgi:hypothetical protein
MLFYFDGHILAIENSVQQPFKNTLDPAYSCFMISDPFLVDCKGVGLIPARMLQFSHELPLSLGLALSSCVHYKVVKADAPLLVVKFLCSSQPSDRSN